MKRSLHLLASRLLAATLVIGAAGTTVSRALGAPLTGDERRAARARASTLELDVEAARATLDGVDPGDALLAVERARLSIYEGDCDSAAAVLSRPDLSQNTEGAELGVIATGCARGSAGTLQIRNDERGVWVRLQDDEDQALVPVLVDVALKVRDTLTKDLGVTLPLPLRIELVRDHFTLAAMTGLPEEAARTTGTVAVAKWGRVFMVTPRAREHGYPWLDTLAHELTHLALSRGTRDKAPLWLQEGVAKREETRWREPGPFDDSPSPDAVAAMGLEKGLGLPIDKIGPSIAMLPTPEQAAVVFAEVQSFIRFFVREARDEALPRLLVKMRDAEDVADLDKAIAAVSGTDFAAWDKRWRAWLSSSPRELPPDAMPGSRVPNIREIARRVRLGQLLGDRNHHRHAATSLGKAQALIPGESSVRCMLAASLVAAGDTAAAAPLVEKIEDVRSGFGRWWSLQGLLHPQRADLAFREALALDPLDPWVACQEKAAPEVPRDAISAAICEAARRVPR
ncbi:MAG: hypothetical protein WKG00_39970 [Polyangiaceae bacterium]